MIGAKLHVDRGAPLGSLTDVAATIERSAVELRLCCSTPTGGWRSIGSVTLERVRAVDSQNLHLDPWNTSTELIPWSWANRLRIPAYRGSRIGRSAQSSGSQTVAEEASGEG